MKPTEYYYVLKKIHSKYPIAGTVVNKEMDLIRKHQKRLRNTEHMDKIGKDTRKHVLNKSIYVAEKVVDIQAETMRSVTALKELDDVVNEKSERLSRLRYGPSNNETKNNNNVNIGDLFDFVKEGNHKMAKRFLLGTPDNFNGVNAGEGSIGNTPLHIATGKGDVTMLKVLLKFGGDPNVRNKLGKVPLHIVWSCWLTAPFYEKKVKKVEAETCIEFLLQYGADPTIPILHNLETPLHTAARLGNDKIIARLLSFGAKPLAENGNGETPLDLAASSKHLEAVRVMANWPSVLKFLRTNEVRAKWSIFLQKSTSTLAQTSTVDSVLLNEKTKVQNQIAMNRQTKGAVRISTETYLLFDKEGGKNSNTTLHLNAKDEKKLKNKKEHEERKRRWVEKKKRAAAERKKKADLKRELEEGGDLYDTDKKKDKNETDDTNKALYRNKHGVGSRPSAMLFKKKCDIYSSVKRFEVRRDIDFNKKNRLSLRLRRLESAEATISDTYLNQGSRPARLSPIRKANSGYNRPNNSNNHNDNNRRHNDERHHNSSKDNDDGVANDADTPTFVTYNDPRSLPPKKTFNSPEVLPKSNSIEFKLMSERKKIAGVKRIDRLVARPGQKDLHNTNIDPWVPAKTEEDIEKTLSFSSAVQL